MKFQNWRMRYLPGAGNPLWIDSLVLFAWGTLVYLGTVHNSLVLDSVGIIEQETRIREIFSSFSFFTQGFLPTKEELLGVKYYRPLVGVFHSIEYKFFGIDPLGYKIVNLLLNSLLGVLAYNFLQKLSQDRFLSFFSIALYIALPLRSEVVYWVYSDSYLFVAIFGFSSLMAFLCDKKILSYVFFVLALFTQEIAVLFPLAGFLVIGARLGFRRAVPPLIVAFATMLAFLLWRRQIVGDIPFVPLAWTEWLNGSAYVFYLAIQNLIWPVGKATAYFYTLGMFAGVTTEIFTGYLLFFGCLLYLVWQVQRGEKGRKNAVWTAWFLLFLLPAFNVGSVGDYVFAEKALALSSFGACVLFLSWLSPVRKEISLIILCTLLVIYGSKTALRAETWKDTRTYLTHVVAFSDKNPLLIVALGQIHEKAGEYDMALSLYETARRNFTGSSKKIDRKIAYVYLLKAHEKEGADAMLLFAKAKAEDATYAEPWFQLGVFYRKKGETANAEEQFTQALKLDGRHKYAAAALGTLMLGAQRHVDCERFLVAYLKFLGEEPPELTALLEKARVARAATSLR